MRRSCWRSWESRRQMRVGEELGDRLEDPHHRGRRRRGPQLRLAAVDAERAARRSSRVAHDDVDRDADQQLGRDVEELVERGQDRAADDLPAVGAARGARGGRADGPQGGRRRRRGERHRLAAGRATGRRASRATPSPRVATNASGPISARTASARAAGAAARDARAERGGHRHQARHRADRELHLGDQAVVVERDEQHLRERAAGRSARRAPGTRVRSSPLSARNDAAR